MIISLRAFPRGEPEPERIAGAVSDLRARGIDFTLYKLEGRADFFISRAIVRAQCAGGVKRECASADSSTVSDV
jgi:uncharacterized protein (UPF0128 family)